VSERPYVVSSAERGIEPGRVYSRRNRGRETMVDRARGWFGESVVFGSRRYASSIATNLVFDFDFDFDFEAGRLAGTAALAGTPL
jgi:hypothetical protein